MERLIYSSSPISSSKIHLKPSPIPRFSRIDNVKLHSPSSSRFEPRRVNLVFCKHDDSTTSPSSSGLLGTSVDSPIRSVPKPEFFDRVAKEVAGQQKAITAGAVILLSALIVISIPVFAPPAFATFQTTATTGAPVTAASVGGKLLRTDLLSSAWTGFFAGCLHTLSGPDHLAALAPLSIGRTRMESAAVGALWGCGHDAGQVIFGLIFLLLKDRLHIEIIRTWGTRIVGFTLVLIGAMGIKEASEAVPTPCLALENGECDVSMYENALEGPQTGKKKIGFATFATGVVHGLQPDALMMVLPALALPSRWAGAAYLGMFLVGTVCAMGSYTVFLGSCSQALKERIPRITEKLTWVSSLIAIVLGFAIIVSPFFGFDLY